MDIWKIIFQHCDFLDAFFCFATSVLLLFSHLSNQYKISHNDSKNIARKYLLFSLDLLLLTMQKIRK